MLRNSRDENEGRKWERGGRPGRSDRKAQNRPAWLLWLLQTNSVLCQSHQPDERRPINGALGWVLGYLTPLGRWAAFFFNIFSAVFFVSRRQPGEMESPTIADSGRYLSVVVSRLAVCACRDGCWGSRVLLGTRHPHTDGPVPSISPYVGCLLLENENEGKRAGGLRSAALIAIASPVRAVSAGKESRTPSGAGQQPPFCVSGLLKAQNQKGR